MRLHVDSLGPMDGPPLVLVHGFGASNHSWRKWMPVLAESYRVHAVELLGFGRSRAPEDADLGPWAQAEALLETLKGILEPGASPTLVGHSLGGGVVLFAALQWQEAGIRPPIRGVVVLSGAVFPQPFPPLIGLARRRGVGELMLRRPPPRWALALGIRWIVAQRETVDREQVEGYRAPLLDPAIRASILRASRQLLPPEGSPAAEAVQRYATLHPPLFALWGDQDRVIRPEFALRLAHAVPDGQALILRGVGHLPQEEAPEASLAPVQRFLAALP